jgi:signal transduction histidine kinase
MSSELQTAMRELRAERDTVAALSQQRRELVAGVSHDLRTPVAAIKAAIGVVLANEPANMPPTLHRLLGNIDLCADELARLIEDLLEIARLQAGRVELWRTQVDLRDAIARAVRPLEPLVEARQQHLELKLPESPVTVAVDVERLGRVVRNLVGNAQKYGRDGGRITVSLEALPGEVSLTVTDDGPGIAAADQERIFERFYRATGPGATGPAGSGLGLPIARALVELHGGRLSVASGPGGSTFKATLPC